MTSCVWVVASGTYLPVYAYAKAQLTAMLEVLPHTWFVYNISPQPGLTERQATVRPISVFILLNSLPTD